MKIMALTTLTLVTFGKLSRIPSVKTSPKAVERKFASLILGLETHITTSTITELMVQILRDYHGYVLKEFFGPVSKVNIILTFLCLVHHSF